MKFGEHLRALLADFSDWSDHFVAYDALKTLIEADAEVEMWSV